MRWFEVAGVTKMRRTKAMNVAQQLALLARRWHALLRHRRGSMTARYYRAPRGAPKVLNSKQLQPPTTCSSSKSSSVAQVRNEQARSEAARTAHSHCVGAVRQLDCDQLLR